jgi:hypothetical protein
MVIEKATKIQSQPIKTTRSTFGNWQVLADAEFYSEESGRSWNYPSKVYYFWSKKRALEFINEVNH